ncbi:hypothetical protein [Blastococcus sp. URHD0036]|uniref:hypothetical protein n=1 Tax=Blastococcus sp. URHD0036 TaxID=1380356 RepID=UPI00049814A8|nr:hypothetical protein [Blastococcus sp. URHD0036]
MDADSDTDPGLDDVADELYGVPPEEFIAARTARVDDARAAGDRALAKTIGALPKPSTAAWAVNVLVRAHREEIEGLIELGGLLREAQDSLAGDELRALNTQRGKLISALTRQASARARELGHPISTAVATQVEETLRAAMADPQAGEAVLAGRLTSPLSYSGMGGVTGMRPQLRVVRDPAPAPARRSTPAGEGDRRAREEQRQEREEAARRAAEEKRLRELAGAREEADAAAALAEETAARAAEERNRAGELDERHERLQARVEELTAELARAEEEATEVAAELRRAERHRTTAERQARDAAAARDRAEAHLRDLEDGG